jgi:hypothetical protein
MRTRHTVRRRRQFGHFPTIARLKNSIKIMVYGRDPTHGPHIHAAYEGNERDPTRLHIEDGRLIEGTRSSLKTPDLREARAWLAANREFALAEWQRLNPRNPHNQRRRGRRLR